jgi:glycosyltransferase involved in cell wall biosynthesis
MHVLWISDSPTTPSGFGNVTRFVCSGLAARGFRVSIMGWQSHGQPTTWSGCQVYPIRRDPFGADVLLGYLQRLRPDVLIALADVWWLAFITHPLVKNFMHTARIRWALYYPIDGDTPEQRLPDSWVQMLQQVDIPIAMSRYGQAVTERCGLRCHCIPHGVDTTIFRPPRDKEAAKAALGYEGHFVILSDARNQPRKMLPRLLEIYRRFAAGKNDVLLHLHCDPDDESACSPLYTYDIRADVAHLGLVDKIRFTDGFRMKAIGGLSLDDLAALYAAADVHLLVSTGEGFGLPTLQAASAGVVPLAVDYSANRELVAGHGETLPVDRYVLNEFGLRRALVDVAATADRLEALYRHPERRAEMARRARQFAESYDWTKVTQQWADLLSHECAAERPMRSPPSTAVRLASGGTDGPAELVAVVRRAMGGLPAGSQVTFHVAEARAGEIELAIQRDAFANGHELSLPVAMPPSFRGAPGRIVGRVCLGPAEVRLFAALRRIFPKLVGLVLGGEAPKLARSSSRGLRWVSQAASQADIAQIVATSALILDPRGSLPRGLDRLAAALGTPYLGSSLYWPGVPPEARSSDADLDQARHLLLNQGATATLCDEARRRLVTREGPRSLELLQELARSKRRPAMASTQGS